MKEGRGKILSNEELWSLTGLENIFHYALDQESKCLIQACILIAEQEFSGVFSFSHQTQVKFLLESIRHIINDNCQEEFIHIMHYLKLLHSLCSDVGCEEEYVNSVLKIKQSFVLYTMLDNESASDVCRIMNNFFLKDDPLQSFLINKASMNRRFLAVIRRQIYAFRKLVTKLLTDMEFRSYYFYDEWLEDYGTTFHKEMVSDINMYIKKIEEYLLAGMANDELYERWMFPESVSNPAMLYFLELFANSEIGELPEEKILKLLKWTFPKFDTTLLTMPGRGFVKVPAVFKNDQFCESFRDAKATLSQNKPWNFESFHQALAHMTESATNLKGHNQTKIDMVYVKVEPTLQDDKETRGRKENVRAPLSKIDDNTLHNRSTMNTRKRKRAGVGNAGNRESKRRRTLVPPTIEAEKKLLVDLGKENVFTKTPKGSNSNRDADLKSTITVSCDTPQCRRLIESGSKFFSSTKRRRIQSSFVIPDLPTPILGEVSNELIQFSDNEDDVDRKNDSNKLNMTKDTMGLTWICASRNSKATPKSHKKFTKKTCRSLSFKSESSDEQVSESESELPAYLQPTLQDCLETLDFTLIPDLTLYLESPTTKPCTVRLRCMSELPMHGNKIDGCEISDADLKIILREDQGFRFRNYSSS